MKSIIKITPQGCVGIDITNPKVRIHIVGTREWFNKTFTPRERAILTLGSALGGNKFLKIEVT